MTLMKKSNFPSLVNERWLTDFFDTDRFFDSDLLKLASVPPLPLVNILEEEKEFVVEMAAPGMKKNDFKIELEGNLLTISSETSNQTEEKEGDRYSRREFSYQSFQRSFTLAKDVLDAEKIKAKYEDGVLRLHIPKKEEVKQKPPRLIQIS